MRQLDAVASRFLAMPYLDPGLPVEYLPEGWRGLAAEALFPKVHGLLGPKAQRYAQSVIRVA